MNDRVVVVGAGVFGAWTAYHLKRAGHDVTLVDAYGPGNSRASSGGETRVIRAGYGAEDIYTQWAWRSLDQWKALFERAGEPPLFRQTGVLWMARDGDPLAAATLATLGRANIPHERLAHGELSARWPQIDFATISSGIFEPAAGVLLARRAVQAVVRKAVRAGVNYFSGVVQSPHSQSTRLQAITCRSGETIEAEAFVFACGPWLPKLFPDVLADRIFVTRQEVVYLGPPAGDARFAAPALPTWIDFGAEMYGMGDIEGRGVKIALDRHGAEFDPDAGERAAGETFAEVRAYVSQRFPALRDAPVVASEVCQYENTSNGDFLLDRHPTLENVWLVGGGSGHGFKHGPALGEYVARLVTGDGAPDERFALTTKAAIQKRSVF